jgi:hypothetical protein
VRLTRRPCAKCGTDTLHEGVKCSACGTIAPDHGLTYAAKIRGRYKRFIKTYGLVGARNRLHASYMANEAAGRREFGPKVTAENARGACTVFGRGRGTLKR